MREDVVSGRSEARHVHDADRRIQGFPGAAGVPPYGGRLPVQDNRNYKS